MASSARTKLANTCDRMIAAQNMVFGTAEAAPVGTPPGRRALEL
jgi:hypothetical protein